MSVLDCPYPLPVVDPSWLTASARGIAEAVAEDGLWDRLPVLADALEDAGCDSKELLFHLRFSHGAIYYCHKCSGHFYIPVELAQQSRERPCPQCGTNARWNSLAEETHELISTTHAGPGLNADGSVNRTGGCWQGTCWAVNHLLGKEQRLVAKHPDPETSGEFWEYPVVNPGGWFGKTWRITHETSHWPPGFIVEADNPGEAEDEWVDSPYGVHARISEEDLKDYEDPTAYDDQGRFVGVHTCTFTGDGTPYDAESIMIDGAESRSRGDHMPFPCLYFGPGLPKKGVNPLVYYDPPTCDQCGTKLYAPPTLTYDGHFVCSLDCLNDYTAANPPEEAETEAT
jgi:DNA-directed RNA polymerase subunit RPC12/RpoP